MPPPSRHHRLQPGSELSLLRLREAAPLVSRMTKQTCLTTLHFYALLHLDCRWRPGAGKMQLLLRMQEQATMLDAVLTQQASLEMLLIEHEQEEASGAAAGAACQPPPCRFRCPACGCCPSFASCTARDLAACLRQCGSAAT